MNGAQAVRQALFAAVQSDARVHVLGEALELSPATRGLMAEAPEQVHLLPAADAGLVGVAVGLAVGGARPVVELAGTPALWGAAQQLGQEAATLAHAPEFRATLVVRVPWAPGQPDPTGLLLGLEHVAIAAPGTAGEAGALVQAAWQRGGVTVVLEPGAVMSGSSAAPGEALPLGTARTLQEGDHATILAFGAGVPAALDAATQLADEGISVDVIDLRSLRPLDTTTVAARVQHTGRVVLAGASEALLPEIVDQAFLRLEAPPAAVPAEAHAIAGAVRTAVFY